MAAEEVFGYLGPNGAGKPSIGFWHFLPGNPAGPCHYSPTRRPMAQMLELDAAAKAVGATALVGTGAGPGITNLLAVLAARELDTVSGLVTGWNIEAAGAHPLRPPERCGRPRHPAGHRHHRGDQGRPPGQ